MTRAALLHLLSGPESLPATAVVDLEQLAQAFPYCQTAHVLLAKAAHDQGNMLAGQRLRRAATYAADRQLLRRLLEQPATPSDALSAAPNHATLVAEATSDAAAAPVLPVPDPAGLPATLPDDTLAAAEAIPAEQGPLVRDSSTESAEVEPDTKITAPDVLAYPEPIEAIEVLASTAEAAPEPQEAGADAVTSAVETFETVVPETAHLPEAEDDSNAAETPVETLEEVSIETAAAAAASDEPEEAPLPIRPPAEAGTARFEFGLNPVLEAGFTSYQLPDSPVAAAFAGDSPRRASPASAGFMGKADLTYALGGGSRLGYALQAVEPTADAGEAARAGTETPGSLLPAAGEFFAPDALLLEHLASQPPLAPPAPSSLELIDSFLRRAPQRRRGIVTLLTVPEQADLSMRSTQAESDLASESLARILAGQGKIARAITVYERLMVRQPEKSAYFAVQIELLRNPPTPSS